MAGGDRKNANSQVLAALATGCTLREVSELTGVSERTISRRLKDPKFKAALDRRKDQILTATVAKLSNASTMAVDTLRELMACDTNSVRLGAARSILELSVSMRTATEFAERIAALEGKQHGKPE